MKTLNVLSLGGGTQSSALLLMSAAGELPKLDAVVFADTQGEMPATYKHLRYLKKQSEAAGIPFYLESKGSLYDDIFDRQGKGMQPNPPVRVRDENGDLQRINKYFCSYDYKRRVVTSAVKRLCGPRGAWRETTVRQWIGYSAEEVTRMKDADECRCGHKVGAHDHEFGCHTTIGAAGQRPCKHGCEGFDPWQVNVWPLIDLGLKRDEVISWMTERGHPEPPRSACFFCPNRGDAHWRMLKQQRPLLWDRAVELDVFVRDGLNGLNGEAFLHQSGTPLATANIGEDLDESDVRFDCDAGVCFT